MKRREKAKLRNISLEFEARWGWILMGVLEEETQVFRLIIDLDSNKFQLFHHQLPEQSFLEMTYIYAKYDV